MGMVQEKEKAKLMSDRPTILFLYTELAGYFLACARELGRLADVHVIHWPVNDEAPFEFSDQDGVKMYPKADHVGSALSELIRGIDPDVIVCSGWVDKEYKAICKVYKKSIPVVVCVDNQWRGSVKQRVASTLSSVLIKPYFNHAWVPGSRQNEFVSKLGFGADKILTGFYCADMDRFTKAHTANAEAKKASFPHRFLYVGRYAEEKGVEALWQAFTNAVDGTDSDWELWCLGVGDIAPMEHPKIRHFGFVQPEELGSYIAQTGVFVLPSKFEPWGVVLQEYAAAGFPLLATSEVGATTEFLKDGVNGLVMHDHRVETIEAALNDIMQMTDEQLIEMGNRSVKAAASITPEKWSQTILKLVS